MSVEDQNAGGVQSEVGDVQVEVQDANNSQGEDVEGIKKNRDKLLAEVKKLKKAMTEQSSVLEQTANDKLAAEGKKDELIAQYKKQLDDVSKKNKEIYANFAFSNVKSQLASEAVKFGCVDVDALIALADLSGVDVDDQNYKADEVLIKGIVEEMKIKKPYLFNKKTPAFDSSFPNATAQGSKGGTDLKNMSSAQLLELAHSLKRQTKGI